jgi:chemotaxis protein methyltransferase CheR
LIKVNCASLTPNLIENELFGHEKGAFSGAGRRHIGRFELAHGATLFLDEIGELPLELQPKLLRALQDGEFERLGSSRSHKVDVRIIAATNRNLEKLVAEGLFRSDLWYRLNTFPIVIPPLRDRLEDIPLLATHFIMHYSNHVGKPFQKIPKDIFRQLDRYFWPGNIRELSNLLFQAVITSEEGNLKVQLPESPRSEDPQKKTFREMERLFLLQSIEACGWRIEGNRGAARKLELKPSTLRHKMKKLHIVRPGT